MKGVHNVCSLKHRTKCLNTSLQSCILECCLHVMCNIKCAFRFPLLSAYCKRKYTHTRPGIYLEVHRSTHCYNSSLIFSPFGLTILPMNRIEFVFWSFTRKMKGWSA